MKTARRISTMLLAAFALTILFAVPALAKTKKVTEWRALKTTDYVYENGKWVREYCDEETYKKNRQTSTSFTRYRDWDDAAGKMVSKKTTTKEKYKYDKKGRRKTCTIYENGKKTNKLVYSYDKKGRESGFKNYNKKGKLISTMTIKYNSRGLTKSITTKYKDGETKTLKDTYSYKYYSSKKIKKQTIKSSDGSKFVVEFNKKGRKTRSTNTGEGYKTVYYYNSKGLVTKTENKSDNSSSVMVYTYDKNGHKTKGVETWIITNNGKKTKDTTTYTYKIKVDKNGNVISEIEYIGKDPMRKTEYEKYKKFTYTLK